MRHLFLFSLILLFAASCFLIGQGVYLEEWLLTSQNVFNAVIAAGLFWVVTTHD